MGFTGGSAVKALPVMQEMWVRSLGQEDPLEKGIAIHSSILAWRIPCTEEHGRLYIVHGVAKNQIRTEHQHTHNALGTVADTQ